MERGAERRQKLSTGLVVGLLHLAAIWGLIGAFAGGLPLRPPSTDELLSVFVSSPPPEPSPSASPRPSPHEGGGAAKAPGARADAASLPPPKLVVVPPRPMPAAITPATGFDRRSGAATADSGEGGGGSGQGSGAGSGDGDDGGTELRLISGEIRESDYPHEAVRQHRSGRVHIRFTVGANGRVSDCSVTRSSGTPSLDEATCRLIIQRFRYEPGRDAMGRPHADTVEGVHDWRMGGSMADDAGDGDE